jgi:hypothetical protein
LRILIVFATTSAWNYSSFSRAGGFRFFRRLFGARHNDGFKMASAVDCVEKRDWRETFGWAVTKTVLVAARARPMASRWLQLTIEEVWGDWL